MYFYYNDSMNDESKVVKVSVRNLVEFMLRSGDLTQGGTGVRNIEAMQAGSRIHRKIQKSMGPGYEAEVPLFTCVPICKPEPSDSGDRGDVRDPEPLCFLRVEGRADGILREPRVLVDEIKGVYHSLKEMKEPEEIHLAQAMCYAYMVLTAEELPEIDVQVTYCRIDKMEGSRDGSKSSARSLIRRFVKTKTAAEVTEWFDGLIAKYTPWVIYEYEQRIRRDESIQELKFPFSFRPGQKELIGFTYRQIEEKKEFFIEAPTGVGKTITTVFPSVKAMGEGLIDRIFYLTAKTITRTVAEECFSLLAGQRMNREAVPPDLARSVQRRAGKRKTTGLCIRPITLTAKEKLCILDRPACDPSTCERAKGHYDRVNRALYELVTQEERWDRETVIRYAEEYRVCPFELSLDAALFADAVIGDYNYVFDPNVCLKRFFANGKKGNMVLLIDEAHNLIERGREMYSAALVKDDVLAVKRIVNSMLKKEKRAEARTAISGYVKALESANRALLAWKRECGSEESDRQKAVMEIRDLGGFSFTLMRVVAAYERMAEEVREIPERETMLTFYFDVRYFLAVWEEFDDHYRIIADYDDSGAFRVTLRCMDPSRRLREVCDRARAAILFSATLLPIRYYREQLGGTDDDAAVYAQSSFEEDKRKILIARDVTSRYKSRGAVMYQRIASYIEVFVTARQGNYLVFFPSYPFMEEVAAFLDLPDTVTVQKQGRSMKEEEREEFLRAFDGDGVVGLCVMGGIFSEGIDLTGERLIGAAIVGTGLPMVCQERELLKEYFDKANGKGFDYAYRFPGVGKVFQAGGRVIRTQDDTGVILLLDERFLQQEYLASFPREWRSYETVTIGDLREKLDRFWTG